VTEYKEFSEEESRIYDREIERLRELINSGLTYSEACEAIEVEDEELRRIVADDILKVMIAELHYQHRLSFEEVARRLDLPLEKISKTHKVMVEDVMYTVNKGGPPDVTIH
jgi:hypothetical protein